MNKKWFFFSIFMIIFSSIMTFLYFVALFISPFIMIPGISKELMTIAILVGIFIGTAMMYFAVKSLYRNGTKVKTVDEPKEKQNWDFSKYIKKNTEEPLNKPEFEKLLDDIKLTKIGPEMMNHVKECQLCTEMSMALNNQVSKHIEDISKHQ